MGIHLCVQTLDCRDHPDWDSCRHAGDREFVDLGSALPQERSESDGGLYRPTDFPAWRAGVAASGIENQERFAHLLDLLEAEPRYWLYLSY